ncbi:MAG: hypothetical protein ABI670_11845 [Chloroflexota bacterium]
MIRELDTLARLLAWARRRAVLIRRTASIAPDPARTFHLAIIRLVGEERIQSAAFGMDDDVPAVCMSRNPLDRDVAFLEPLARALDEYVRSMLAQSELPRVWIANEATRQCLSLLAQRYSTNRNASEIIRTLGLLCSALVSDSEHARAQSLITAVPLLNEHVRTGQSPLQDASLGAILAWVSPAGGADVDPWVEADQQALKPSAAMLCRTDDHRLEQQRDRARRARMQAARFRALADKIESSEGREGGEVREGRESREGSECGEVREASQGSNTQSQEQVQADARRVEELRERAARAEKVAGRAETIMTGILTDAALDEYSLLLEARAAFKALPLLPCPGIERLVDASKQRLMSILFGGDVRPSPEPHTLSIELSAREHAAALTESIYISGDDLIREQARLQGRAVRGVVVDVCQPRSNRRPCNIVILTQQTVLRIRPGTRLRVRNSAMVGRVAAVTEDSQTGGTIIDLELTAGLRSTPALGDEIDADDAVLFGASHRARRVYLHMARTRPALVYGDLPAPWPRSSLPSGDLLAVARHLRRS